MILTFSSNDYKVVACQVLNRHKFPIPVSKKTDFEYRVT